MHPLSKISVYATSCHSSHCKAGWCLLLAEEWGLGRGEHREKASTSELSQRGPGGAPLPMHFWHIWGPQNTSDRENSVTLLNNVWSPKSNIFIWKWCIKSKFKPLSLCFKTHKTKAQSNKRHCLIGLSPLPNWCEFKAIIRPNSHTTRHYKKQAHLTNEGRNTVHAAQSYPQLCKMKMADC